MFRFCMKKKEMHREDEKIDQREEFEGSSSRGVNARSPTLIRVVFAYRAVRILGHEDHEGAAAVAKRPQLQISARTIHRVDAVTVGTEISSNVKFQLQKYTGNIYEYI